jgi:hypothetical protein
MKPFKYVSVEDVKQYRANFPSFFPATVDPNVDPDIALAKMINWFAEGAVTSLSSHLYYSIAEGAGDHLTFGLAKGCRCGSCNEWQIRDDNNQIVESTEQLSDWVIQRG